MDTWTRLLSQARSLGLMAFNAVLPTVLASRDQFRDIVGSSHFVRNTLGVVVLAAAAINFKNLPLVWHWRIFKAIFHQLYLEPTARTPRTLFAPVITSSYNSLYDTDFNLHKSDSTYFADLDVSRVHCLAGLIHTGVRRLQADNDRDFGSRKHPARARFYVALGGVACHFRREIPPLRAFEIHTRVLTWDHKWLYLVSHVVEEGRIKPSNYALQPWRSSSIRKTQDPAKESCKQGRGEEQARLRKYIYATSIARYVCKRGQTTISPETILERSSLLPPRPEEAALGVATAAEDKEWTWNDMEAEKLHGLEMARHFDALSGLHDEQRPGEAVGQYSDWF